MTEFIGGILVGIAASVCFASLALYVRVRKGE